MNKIHKIFTLVITCTIVWATFGRTTPAVAQQGSDRVTVIDDFADGKLPAGTDGGVPIGFYTWSDGSSVSIEAAKIEPGSPMALPDQIASKTVLKLNTDIKANGWAGYTHAFTNETLDKWTTRDWSSYEGIALWLYSNGTGGSLFVDLLENRGANSKKDDAERWSLTIPDDAKGWRHVKLAFKDFRRKDIGNGAPNDGLTLSEIHGYAVGNFGSKEMGKHSDYVGPVSVYGLVTEEQRPVEVSFQKDAGSAVKGGKATFTLKLNKPAKVPVTVELVGGEGTALENTHYSIPTQKVTFAPGSIEEKVKIDVADDGKPTGQRRAVLVLANPQGATLGVMRRSILTIRDTYPTDPNLLIDFDELPPFASTSGVTISAVPAKGDLALPQQKFDANVLKVSYDLKESGFTGRYFAEPQSWNGKTGLTFWAYGSNTGKSYSIELLTGKSTPETAPKDWKLAWSDEFDTPAGTSPNPAIWKPELGDGLLNSIPGWGNNELEHYTGNPENAATDGNGNLVITVRKVDPATTKLACWYGACEYTSSRLITANALEVAYGRIEARMKLPKGKGLWPAFWTLGTNIGKVGWPESGEIDIMEHVGHESSRVLGTIHGPDYSGGKGISKNFNLQSGNFADEFHVFSLEWEPNELRWYVDNMLYSTLTPKDLPAGARWVFNHPFFIIMNVAVGGNLPGNPDATTQFPQSLTVDYVRVYQAPSDYQRFADTFKDDFTGWKQITLPFSAFVSEQKQATLNLADVWGYGLRVPAGNGAIHLDKFVFVP